MNLLNFIYNIPSHLNDYFTFLIFTINNKNQNPTFYKTTYTFIYFYYSFLKLSDIISLESGESKMNKQTRNIFIIFFLIFFVIPFISTFFSYYDSEESTGPNDYARITDIDYKAVLVDEPGEGGKVVITERLTYDIHAASKNNLFWELWRDLPEDYIDGLKVDYQVNYVKQINDDGTETTYTESPKLYWDDSDYTSSIYGPGKWYHSEGPYDEDSLDMNVYSST